MKSLTRKRKKSSLVGVRFFPEEKQKLKQLAAQQNKSLSQLIRAAALRTTEMSRRKVIPEVNRRLYFELGKVSEKLQTANSQQSAESSNTLQELLAQVRRELMGMD